MKKKTVEVTKTMQIGQVLKINPNVKDVLMGFGLHCFGCPMSRMETIEQASMVHGADVNLMLEKLNELNAKKTDKIVARKKCCRKPVAKK